MKIDFFSSAIIAAVMTATSIAPSLASGGDDPVEGIDIIIKNANYSAEFSKRDLKSVNALKGLAKPSLIAKIAAGYLTRATKGDAPKAGWGAVLKKGLIADWNVDERGGTTAIKVRTKGSEKPMTVIIKIGR